ncbi:MAG: C_GCAxxG_C_C family protein [Acidobacteria bacterium]|nr:C_GCAxxG_C_C family protein [Acidobacteriota bacterium]
MHNPDVCSRRGCECGRRRFLAAFSCFPPACALAIHPPERQRSGNSPARTSLTTEDRIALALLRFREGFHCSQSVLETYAADLGLEPDTARSMAAALAGGSTAGGECGVIGSGYLVLGLRYAGFLPAHGDVEREDRLWSRVRRFLAEFGKRHGAITCRELLGVDVFTKEGREEALRRNLFASLCTNHIRSGIEILDSLG